MAIGNPGGHFSSFHPLPVMPDSERASVIKKTKPLKKRKISLKKKQNLRLAIVRLGYVIHLCYKDKRIAYF